MKPIHEWELSTDAFILQDMVDASCLKRGPRDPNFADAVIRLLRNRVIDPGVSRTDIGRLTLDQVAVLGQRILVAIVEQLRIEQAMPSIRKMVDEACVPPSKARSGPDGFKV